MNTRPDPADLDIVQDSDGALRAPTSHERMEKIRAQARVREWMLKENPYLRKTILALD